MKLALIATALILPIVTAPVLADPGKNESGHGSRERAGHYREAEREYRKHQQERAREQRKRAREWEREHRHHHHAVPAYMPYVAEPAYPSEGITITRDGIDVWFTL